MPALGITDGQHARNLQKYFRQKAWDITMGAKNIYSPTTAESADRWLKHNMKAQVRERIVENNGRITAENDKLIKAEFSYREMEKAVKVFFEMTKHLNQDAILHGGCRLTVYYKYKPERRPHLASQS